MLRNNNNNQSWFSIVFLVVLVICQSHQSAGALIELSSDLIINGGPGQAIAFYGTNSAAIFNVTQSFAENNASSFTLEFWFAETCSFGSCTLFSLNTDKYSTYAVIVVAIKAFILNLLKSLFKQACLNDILVKCIYYTLKEDFWSSNEWRRPRLGNTSYFVI